jgi:hypothetical protein
MNRRLGLLLVVLISVFAAAAAQDVPLDSCRQLPMVKVKIGTQEFQFLLDTGAAATLLNRKSFSSQQPKEIMMESWNGPAATSAFEVVLHDFTVGAQSLSNLALLAVDLTPLERSCQRRVDGVLGADLIARLGLTIDLKNHLATVDANVKTPQARFSQFDQHQATCVEAFNRSDAKTFEQCLDPDIVLLTTKGDYHGRKAVMKHFKDDYFGQSPPVMVSLTPRGHHALGPVIWIEYDLAVTAHGEVMRLRGTAVYQRSGERWLMSNMNYSAAENDR